VAVNSSNDVSAAVHSCSCANDVLNAGVDEMAAADCTAASHWHG